MWRLAVCVLVLGAAASAGADGVRAGRVTRLTATERPSYSQILWVEAHADDDVVELVAFPGPTSIGDDYDVVDEKGVLGRARVTRLEPSACGPLTYVRARAQLIWPGMTRQATGAVVALGPAHGRLGAARVLPSAERPPGEDPGRLFIDVDGDGKPDLARQLTLDCGAARGRSISCVETWVRDDKKSGNDDGWRRVMRAEVGPCG